MSGQSGGGHGGSQHPQAKTAGANGASKGQFDFKRGDTVWAKVRGYSWWPAKIGEVIGGRFAAERKYKVDFLGDNTHQTVAYDKVCDFIENYTKHSVTKKSNLLDSIALARESLKKEEQEELQNIIEHKAEVTKKVPAPSRQNGPKVPQQKPPVPKQRGQPVQQKRDEESEGDDDNVESDQGKDNEVVYENPRRGGAKKVQETKPPQAKSSSKNGIDRSNLSRRATKTADKSSKQHEKQKRRGQVSESEDEEVSEASEESKKSEEGKKDSSEEDDTEGPRITTKIKARNKSMKQEDSSKGKASLLNKAEDVRKLESRVIKAKDEGKQTSKQESALDLKLSEQKLGSKSESEDSGEERMNPEEEEDEAKNGTLPNEDELISPENSADLSIEEELRESSGSQPSSPAQSIGSKMIDSVIQPNVRIDKNQQVNDNINGRRPQRISKTKCAQFIDGLKTKGGPNPKDTPPEQQRKISQDSPKRKQQQVKQAQLTSQLQTKLQPLDQTPNASVNKTTIKPQQQQQPMSIVQRNGSAPLHSIHSAQNLGIQNMRKSSNVSHNIETQRSHHGDPDEGINQYVQSSLIYQIQTPQPPQGPCPITRHVKLIGKFFKSIVKAQQAEEELMIRTKSEFGAELNEARERISSGADQRDTSTQSKKGATAGDQSTSPTQVNMTLIQVSLDNIKDYLMYLWKLEINYKILEDSNIGKTLKYFFDYCVAYEMIFKHQRNISSSRSLSWRSGRTT